ncbi:MAG: T9SS C-terminal target domain-containing protein, partial [Bacteroidetes bacterium]|nr:T9SS C-terminal target domain-containing protein [Bacteroidota bacterium]
MANKITLLIGFILLQLSVFSQSAPFSLALEPVSISGLDGLQAYAFGQHDGKWLIMGGRLDGLHLKQPHSTFDIPGHNDQLIVIDPENSQKWAAPLTPLSASMREQLSSTNMEFYQEGDYLYCIGGYGYSATVGDHTTYSNLTAIKVPDVINAIINGNDYATYFRQISDPLFQVTGGRLKKMDGNYYLMGGQKFLGRYNPMGPTHGPGFTQVYTNAVRIFSLTDDGTTISINHLPSYTDAANLHRRDYNAEPQILPDGTEGLTMFSGVFQSTVDLPFLNSVTIDSAGYAVNDSFQQYYNHYHCPAIPLYSEANNEMHTVFFGGIAQYYDNEGVLTQDNNVPFVKTIARVTRDENGKMAEYKLPVDMPALLGASAEFIPNENIARYDNDVFKLDEITQDSTLVGYIYGGINSSGANIFWVNDGSQSSASSQVFKVYLTNNNSVGIHDLNEQSISTLGMQVFPNPNQNHFSVKFNLKKHTSVSISLYTIEGKLIEEKRFDNLVIGENMYQ